ncbi:CD276 antigen homolog isoform X2 [Labeo rohita]|uniref:CD276 antigen homolog isoform X2 n=1 Tax=Labeo rohita TaxID=84645 RepID=UPI0021E26152|nr:CD276 antigen homolog isoform X2 [Labeo rohita]
MIYWLRLRKLKNFFLSLSLCFCSYIVFTVLINKESVIGGSVVLPCSSNQHDLKLQDTDVHWRDKTDTIVYSIIKGNHSVEGQGPQYKNRAETFPDEYLRGNFSIKLTALTHADAGKYICYITNPSDSQKETVELIIKESTSETGHKPCDQENQAVHSGADHIWKSGPLLLLCIVVALLLL